MEALPSLSPSERAELVESLQAIDEGVSVPELRAMNAAIDEALNDPSPSLTIEEVEEEMRKLCRDNATSA